MKGDGVYLDDCTTDLDCGPSLGCAAAAYHVPDLCKSAACCMPWCDVDSPNCPDGTMCWPLGAALPDPGLEHVGQCDATFMGGN